VFFNVNTEFGQHSVAFGYRDLTLAKAPVHSFASTSGWRTACIAQRGRATCVAGHAVDGTMQRVWD
jgi:hypothetical protein